MSSLPFLLFLKLISSIKIFKRNSTISLHSTILSWCWLDSRRDISSTRSYWQTWKYFVSFQRPKYARSYFWSGCHAICNWGFIVTWSSPHSPMLPSLLITGITDVSFSQCITFSQVLLPTSLQISCFTRILLQQELAKRTNNLIKPEIRLWCMLAFARIHRNLILSLHFLHPPWICPYLQSPTLVF